MRGGNADQPHTRPLQQEARAPTGAGTRKTTRRNDEDSGERGRNGFATTTPHPSSSRVGEEGGWGEGEGSFYYC